MVSKLVQYICVCLITLQVVLGHFTLTYPSSRGFNEDQEAISPCGGFNTVSENRVVFPLEHAFIEINSGHTAYKYEINAITGNSTTLIGSGSRSYPQASCLPFDHSPQDGVNATIQVVYNGGDGLLYQCVDATFQSSAPSFNTSACVNADGSPSGNNTGSSGGDNHDGNNSGASTLQVGGTILFALIVYLLV